jgi:dipeptidase D
MSTTAPTCWRPSDLQPAGLWAHFAAITRIPRPSKHEEKMRDYILKWAKSLKFDIHGKEDAGNMVVHVPPTPGREVAQIVALQAHLDMVCQHKKGSAYDAAAGNILVVREGDWIVAPETTLGADNGIGVAAMLWLAEEKSIVHGPLDLVFTIDEEAGMTGAANLELEWIRGRTLINLDTEEDWFLCVGSAGGADTRIVWNASRQPVPSGQVGTKVSLVDLRGGHSGTQIQENRLNAIKALTRILSAADGPLLLSSIEGGNAHNAIPRTASAVVFHPADRTSAARTARTAFSRAVEELRQQYPLEVKLADTTIADAAPASVFSEADSRRVLDLLSALPSGVLAMSAEFSGLVESSSNLAVVRTSETQGNGGHVEITCSSRSSIAPALREILDSLQATARLAGAAVQDSDGYPGWKPDMDSRILDVVRAEYKRLFAEHPDVASGKHPVVGSVHAGLECGYFKAKISGLDILSIGPTIVGPHAPGEKVSIASVGKFCRLLTVVLDRLSK